MKLLPTVFMPLDANPKVSDIPLKISLSPSWKSLTQSVNRMGNAQNVFSHEECTLALWSTLTESRTIGGVSHKVTLAVPMETQSQYHPGLLSHEASLILVNNTLH